MSVQENKKTSTRDIVVSVISSCVWIIVVYVILKINGVPYGLMNNFFGVTAAILVINAVTYQIKKHRGTTNFSFAVLDTSILIVLFFLLHVVLFLQGYHL